MNQQAQALPGPSWRFTAVAVVLGMAVGAILAPAETVVAVNPSLDAPVPSDIVPAAAPVRLETT